MSYKEEVAFNCIEKFEQELSSHVKRFFATTFRYKIYSNEESSRIKAFLKEDKIRY